MIPSARWGVVTVRPRTRYRAPVQNLNDALIRTALSEYGVATIAGPMQTARMARYLAWLRGNPQTAEWSAAFMTWVMMQVTGQAVSRSTARGWTSLVEPFRVTELGGLRQGRGGDVVVVELSERRARVGLLVRSSAKAAWVLGGTMGGRVEVTSYPASQVVAVRRYCGPITAPESQPA